LTPYDLFEYGEKNISGVKFFYVSSDEIETHSKSYQLDDRYANATKIPGTRTYHAFCPDKGNILLKRFSSDTGTVSHLQTFKKTFEPGKYLACVYDNEWYLGNIIERNDDENDYFVNFMKKKGNNKFSWPIEEKPDQCWVPFSHVLMDVEVPIMTGRSGRDYKISDDEFTKIENLFRNFSF
jgi:hypothetical protein